MIMYFFIVGMVVSLKILFIISWLTFKATSDKLDPLAEKNDIEYLILPTVISIAVGFVSALGFDFCYLFGVQ